MLRREFNKLLSLSPLMPINLIIQQDKFYSLEYKTLGQEYKWKIPLIKSGDDQGFAIKERLKDHDYVIYFTIMNLINNVLSGASEEWVGYFGVGFDSGKHCYAFFDDLVLTLHKNECIIIRLLEKNLLKLTHISVPSVFDGRNLYISLEVT